MSLNKKTYVKNWDHMKPEEKHTITIKGPTAKSIKPERIYSIEEEIITWRKANQIHKWFVDNVQDGNDDCKEYYVSSAQLQELLDTINKALVLKTKIVAKKYLPTKTGFFFGSEDYDEYYWEQLEDTKQTLEKVLKEEPAGSFYYSSSW